MQKLYIPQLLKRNDSCNYILIHQVVLAKQSKGTFWSSIQAAICSLVSYTLWRLHTDPFY